MLLFERCGTPEAYKELTTAINNGEGGRPLFLAEWEKQAVAGEALRNLSKVWEPEFAKEWLALPPALAGLDLRPVLYVSREHAPLVTAADQLTSVAAGVLEALLGQHKRVNDALKNQVKALSGREVALIMERLLVRAKQEQRWGTPSILYACLTVVGADPSHSDALARFLEALPGNSVQPDIIPLISDATWASRVLNRWKSSTDVSNPVKKAIASLSEGSS
jgi:predicted KAP-like P-loop ATPase